MIKPTSLWKVTYIPWEKNPIRSMNLFVVAETREEARKIAMEQLDKFLNLDAHVFTTKLVEGYKMGEE